MMSRTSAVRRSAPGAAVLAAVLTLSLTACAGEETSGTTPTGVPEAAPTASPPPSADEVAPADDPCALLTEEELGTVFGGARPKADGNPMGAGFADCRWKGDDITVLVSVVPTDKLATDYPNQLATMGPAAGIGDGAVVLDGFVGIGRVSARGATVGFTAGDSGLLVAVSSPAGNKADHGAALTLARAVHARLG